MPEGPSIVILKGQVQQFKNQKILRVEGNSKLDIQRLSGEKIIDFKSWGKHFLICFKSFSVRIHLMMFGSYRINEEKETPPRLSLIFKNGKLNFYTCSLKFIEEDVNEVYDWTSDVMNDDWNPKAAKNKLKVIPEVLICDALLNQNIFAGVGNIIKNEVLFRIRLHPENKIKDVSVKKINELIKEARNYSFEFLKWKKEFVLKKHWLAYTKKICPRCNILFIKKYSGKTKRRTFFCTNCQLLYGKEILKSGMLIDKKIEAITINQISMIRKLKSGEYRLYSRKKDAKTNKRKNFGTFKTRSAAEKHEQEIQYFKRH